VKYALEMASSDMAYITKSHVDQFRNIKVIIYTMSQA
jgi:hypothetical protein